MYDADAPAADPKVLALGAPVLGICYGLQFIVHHLGGKVRSAAKREYGHAEVALEDRSTPLFAGLPATLAGVDEPRRRGAGVARWLLPHCCSSNALAGIEKSGTPHLGGAVSSRGAPHAAGSSRF